MTHRYAKVHEASFNLGHEEGHQKNLEHLWHTALTVDPDLSAEGFDPQDLPGMVQSALDEAYAQGFDAARTGDGWAEMVDAFNDECDDLQRRNFDLQDRLLASRSFRKARDKETRRRCREKVQRAQEELQKSKERSKDIQHELYVALKASEGREQRYRALHSGLKKNLEDLEFKNTLLQSQVMSMQRDNDTAERDLGALIHMAEQLNLPGSEPSEDHDHDHDYDYDRLVNVINECYSRITELEKWIGLPRYG